MISRGADRFDVLTKLPAEWRLPFLPPVCEDRILQQPDAGSNFWLPGFFGDMALHVEVILAVLNEKPLGNEPAKPTNILRVQRRGVRRGVPYPKEPWLPGHPCMEVDDQLESSSSVLNRTDSVFCRIPSPK